MSNFLKQATASQSRAIGPFLDDTDFKTAETGLTIANTDIKLIVNGGASADKNSGGGTHRANGVYGITFDATDTATVGELEVSVKVAGALPVFKTFYVLEEAIFDALFGASATGLLPANTTQWGGTAVASANVLIDGAITAAKIGADAITAAKVAADVHAEAADAVWDEAQAGHVGAGTFGEVATEVASILVDTAEIGAAGAGLTEAGGTGDHLTALATQASVNTVDTVVDAILLDTAEIGAAGAGLTALATQTSVNTVDTVVDAIKVKTDSLTFTTAGRVDASARDISGSTAATTALARSAAAIVTGTCAASGTTTSVIASSLTPTSAVNDQFNGRILIFAADTTTTALRGQATDITDYVHGTLTMTVTALTTAPAEGDTFVIV